MKKLAYQTYYRDKNGELRVQLVDAVTGKSVKNPKEYIVLDSTTQQGLELTGEVPTSDKSTTKAEINYSDIKKRNFSGKTSGTGDKRDPEKLSKRAPGTAADNFGFIDKPGWSKYAGPAASLIGGPLVGGAVSLANVGVNANNLSAINQAREAFGLKPMSNKDFMKGLVKGVDEGVVGDVDIGNGATRSVGLADAVVDGVTTMTPREAQDRRALASTQESAARNKANPQSKLHPEIDPGFKAPSVQAPTVSAKLDTDTKAGRFVGNYKKGVDARLEDTMVRAAALYERDNPGYHVSFFSGKNPRKSTENHPKGWAMDMRITDPSGKVLGNLRDPTSFRQYESVAQYGKAIIDQDYPELSDDFAFGGYFQQGVAFDQMHVDIGGARGKYGDFKNGLNKLGRQNLAGAESIGMAQLGPFNLDSTGTKPAFDPTKPGFTPNVQVASLDTPEAIEGYIRDAAIARNIDPDVAVAVAKSEGLQPGTYQSLVGLTEGKQEHSYGPFQLNIDGGLGTEFQKATGLDPTDPSTVQAQIDYALDHAAKHGWGVFHGAANTGIAPRAGLDNAIALGLTPTTKPADMVDITADPFEKYTKSFYDAVQKQPEPSKIAGPQGDMGRIDSPSSGRPSMSGSNRPASMSNTVGLGDRDHQSFGSSYSGLGGQNSPGEGSRFGGSGLGSLGNGNKSTPSSFGAGFNGPGGGNTNSGSSYSGTKDKEKDSQGATGQYGLGSFGGPR